MRRRWDIKYFRLPIEIVVSSTTGANFNKQSCAFFSLTDYLNNILIVVKIVACPYAGSRFVVDYFVIDHSVVDRLVVDRSVTTRSVVARFVVDSLPELPFWIFRASSSWAPAHVTAGKIRPICIDTAFVIGDVYVSDVFYI